MNKKKLLSTKKEGLIKLSGNEIPSWTTENRSVNLNFITEQINSALDTKYSVSD